MNFNQLAVVFIFGAVVGSFLNVCIHRLPLEQSVVTPRSRCPGCHNQIAWYDNIPLLSWLLLKARCRHCKSPVSIQYPLIELLAALLGVGILHHFGLNPTGIALLILAYACVVMTVIDLYHYILPNVITYSGMIGGVGLALAGLWFPGFTHHPLADWEASLIGVVAGGGGLWGFAALFELITRKQGMGMGDVKLLGMIGAWLGWQALPFTIMISAVLGSIVGITWIVVAGRDRHLPIPFGPYLVAAAWGYIFWGSAIYNWYFGLVGLANP